MSLNDFNSSLYEVMKTSSSEALTKLLRTIDGPKDLILDDDLITTLDHIASMSELRVSGVEKIFKLGPNQLPLQSPRSVYLIRSLMKSVMLIANHLKADTIHQRQAYIIFVPRKLHVCELILEQEGVYGEAILLEYPLGFIPLDIDLYSLEIPNFFLSCFLEGDQTWLHTAASSLIQLQRFCGSITNIYGLGQCAKMVTEMFKQLNDEIRQSTSAQSEIDFAIIIDRDLDYPSLLLTQLTYEGLLDETFGIKSARVALGEEVTGKKQVVKIILNSMDEIFKETRDRHFSNVFTYLGNKARHIQAKRDETQRMNVGDMKKFVANELRDLQQQHKYLALHIGACEVIMKQKGKGDFKQHLTTEHNLLDCVELRECMNYIEETINRQLPLLDTLRLLCLLSITQDGLTSRDYRSFITQFLQSHGHKHLLTFHNLKKLGLFTEQTSVALPLPGPTYAGAAAAKVVAAVTSRGSSFKTITKKLGLIPKVNEDIDLKTPSDMSYVFSGAYIPLICKLVQQLLTREGFQGMEDILKLIGRPTITYSKPRTVRNRGSVSSVISPGSENGRNKVILIYFLGGVTYAEIAALKLLAKQNNYTLLVATTNLMNGNSLLQQLVS